MPIKAGFVASCRSWASVKSILTSGIIPILLISAPYGTDGGTRSGTGGHSGVTNGGIDSTYGSTSSGIISFSKPNFTLTSLVNVFTVTSSLTH